MNADVCTVVSGGEDCSGGAEGSHADIHIGSRQKEGRKLQPLSVCDRGPTLMRRKQIISKCLTHASPSLMAHCLPSAFCFPPTSGVLFVLFILFACFASSLLDSFDPVQGQWQEGEEEGKEELRGYENIRFYIMIIRPVGLPISSPTLGVQTGKIIRPVA